MSGYKKSWYFVSITESLDILRQSLANLTPRENAGSEAMPVVPSVLAGNA